MTRDELLDRLWAQDGPNVFITRRQYEATLDGWDIRPYEKDGLLVGATIVRGPEIHFATFGVRWRLTRADIAHHLAPLIEMYGEARVRTAKDDARQQRFNRALGFTECGEDEFFIHFRLERLPMKKDNTCQP